MRSLLYALAVLSLPLRGAWIEMQIPKAQISRSVCRSPCGERGLKYSGLRECGQQAESLPLRGAWIEIESVKCKKSS